MTTTVTVTTHAWPARVMGFPKTDGVPNSDAEFQELEVVEPNSERVFYPHAELDILVQELPQPESTE